MRTPENVRTGGSAPRTMRCAVCDRWFRVGAGWDGLCPRCGLTVSVMTCSRCGHTWSPRDMARRPQRCPSCKSPYWDRERLRDPVTNEWLHGRPKGPTERRAHDREV